MGGVGRWDIVGGACIREPYLRRGKSLSYSFEGLGVTQILRCRQMGRRAMNEL